MKLLKTSIVVAGMALSLAACHKNASNVTDENSVNITENATSSDMNATDMNATGMNASGANATDMNATDVNATGGNASGNGVRSDNGPRG